MEIIKRYCIKPNFVLRRIAGEYAIVPVDVGDACQLKAACVALGYVEYSRDSHSVGFLTYGCSQNVDAESVQAIDG